MRRAEPSLASERETVKSQEDTREPVEREPVESRTSWPGKDALDFVQQGTGAVPIPPFPNYGFSSFNRSHSINICSFGLS